jgi:PPOX class probable F420-dependent enzyme
MLDTTTEAGGRAERRLREEEIAWLTTVRSDGQPQSVPVWFFWDGEKFLVYSRPGRQKLRNIDRDPRARPRYSRTRRPPPRSRST